MKTHIHKNIDLVQIDVVAGTSEYELPKNVDWVGKKIDKLVLCAPTNSCLSPIDGSSVLRKRDISNLYFDLYAADNSAICQNLHYTNLLYTNNFPVAINNSLSLQLSRVKFTSAPEISGAMLLYVYYDGREEAEYEMPKRSETITFPLAPDQLMTFTEIINTYFHVNGNKVMGVCVWDAENNPAYLTLRDHELNYVINSMHTVLARPEMAGVTAEESQTNPMYLDCADIDFDYSNIRNATSSASVQKITLLY